MHTCYLAKFGRSRSNSMSVITEICWRNLTAYVLPLTVIGTDVALISSLWLPISDSY